MPVEVTERVLHDALALAGEWDPDGTPGAQAALEWMGWEGDGPLWLRRYDVQLFVWYTLPGKFLTSLEHKRETAAVLARTLDRLGDRAATYADVCRSPETDELLHAWEVEDPAAWKRFRELLDRSGIEPPDTDLLAWGQVMGFEEARVREQVATALEEAIEDGRLSPGSAGFRRRQAEVANAALHGPWMAATGAAASARNLGLDLADHGTRLVIRDRDSKYNGAFDEVFRSAGIRVVKTPVRAPQANAIAERFVRTVRAECLDWLLILNRRHLESVLRVFVDHYNKHRPHRALELQSPQRARPSPTPAIGDIRRRDRLGGLIHEYYRDAA